jgi:hypothetical protein
MLNVRIVRCKLHSDLLRGSILVSTVEQYVPVLVERSLSDYLGTGTGTLRCLRSGISEELVVLLS